MQDSLCESCSWVKEIVSGRGSRFLMCERSKADPRFPKYPPQPIGHCEGHTADGGAPEATGFTLELLLDHFAICRFEPDAPLPEWVAGAFVFIARTIDELSVVCAQDAVPPDTKVERDWRCFRVAGKLDFSLVGVIASLTAPLAEARISVFVTSTFDTDYVAIRSNDVDAAAAAWRAAGHQVTGVR